MLMHNQYLNYVENTGKAPAQRLLMNPGMLHKVSTDSKKENVFPSFLTQKKSNMIAGDGKHQGNSNYSDEAMFYLKQWG